MFLVPVVFKHPILRMVYQVCCMSEFRYLKYLLFLLISSKFYCVWYQFQFQYLYCISPRHEHLHARLHKYNYTTTEKYYRIFVMFHSMSIREALALCRTWQKFLVNLNRAKRRHSPPCCVAEITGLIVLQSR